MQAKVMSGQTHRSNEPKPGFDSKNLIALANNWQNLKSIHINQDKEFTKESVEVLLSNRGPSLKYFCLSNNFGEDITFRFLVKHNLIHHLFLCKELEKLSIERVSKLPTKALPKNITELCIKDIYLWDSKDFIRLFTKFSNQHIRVLS